ncbi:MAG TPA: hypothetical protein VKY33_00120 [Flavobacterium sp.]|nr:hypothetical protein [Flavobacterium sp.]
MFDAISNINPSGKKKFKSQLIPAIYFKNNTKNISITSETVSNTTVSEPTNPELNHPKSTEQTDLNIQKVQLSKSSNEHTVSALSLKSIRKKRELEAAINPVQTNPEDLPKDNFTFDELKEHWDFCATQFYKTGRMLMSSTMNMAKLTLNENQLIVEFPNKGTQLSFEENLYDLISYIHRKLNNYHLKVEVKVNEQVEVKRAYTIDDKLDYLKELNPTLDKLIKTFDLDVKP